MIFDISKEILYRTVRRLSEQTGESTAKYRYINIKGGRDAAAFIKT